MTSVLKKSRGSKGKSESSHEDLPLKRDGTTQSEDVGRLVKYIDESVVGRGNSFCGPFGRRRVIYCDYSGSGRALQCVEDYVVRDVLPAHATTCSALCYTSGQREIYRSESLEIIRTAVRACSEDVLALGASLRRLLRVLRPQRVLLFVSARETERNLAPWRECAAEIIKIPETKEGYIDLNSLEHKLQQNAGTDKRMIGFFAAASEVTGVLADDVATSLLLHQYGAWSFWDYTLVAPSCGVDMNPAFPGVDAEMVRKDAIFFDCEKFVGGVQGPHVAVVKRHVFRGTPVYCDDVEDLSERIEEWRTTEAVRAAMALQLRDGVGLQCITERQASVTRQVLSHIKNIPELILLGSGSPTARRLPIFSFMVKHPRGAFLHHNFVCAILNDVFGIQARGGFSTSDCGSDILGIDDKLLVEYEKVLDVEAQKEVARLRKLSDAKSPEVPLYNEHLRPGCCRVSLPYFISEGELAFVLEALKMVATEGWKLLPQYAGVASTGRWHHQACAQPRERKSLHSIRFSDGKMSSHERRVSGPGIFPQTHTECLQTARNLFSRARKLAMKCTIEPEVGFNPRIDYLRWYMLPKEAHELLLGKSANVKHIVPFHPSGYTGARNCLHNQRGMISSPVLGSSARHFSLSAIDDCPLHVKQKFYSRESSLKEVQFKEQKVMPQPVQFALGESVSPLRLVPHLLKQPIRARCYSLGSDDPAIALSAQAKINLGLKEKSPSVVEKTVSSFCNCGSQTDLLSLDDPMISPENGNFSQGRASPAISNASEDLQAYVKEMTKEIATEIKSEIREVISRVDDILENSDSIEQSNLSLSSLCSQSERNSVSVTDVAEYLMGMSREMASEVQYEIREVVNQVDEMMSPESCSRKSSPPTSRQRIYSGPELGFNSHSKKPNTKTLRKCPTSPVFPLYDDDDKAFKTTQKPQESSVSSTSGVSGPDSISFSTPETTNPAVSIQTSRNFSQSSSSTRFSDDEVVCNNTNCCNNTWCQNTSVSSHDSGINMAFADTDSYVDCAKWRTSSDPTPNAAGKLQGRLRMRPRDQTEVPDIIEGVPVCQGDYVRSTTMDNKRCRSSTTSSRCSASSSASSARSSGYGSDLCRTSLEHCLDRSCDNENRLFKSEHCWEQDEADDSSDSSLPELACDGWRCPPQHVWQPTVEAIHEYDMIRPGDKVLVCLSGGRESMALLHTMRQYQFYARAKGIHFTIGALFVEDNSGVDPLHLMAYCRSLGVKFIYQDKAQESQPVGASRVGCELTRWACHAVRRRAYSAARGHGYSVLALGQALDHAAAAFLAAVLRAGRLAAVRAHYSLREQELRVIRPLVYVRRGALSAWARAAALPHCKITKPTLESECSRPESDVLSESLAMARALLAAQERAFPRLFASVKSALLPLVSGRIIGQDAKERQRKKSVIQMKNGAPVYDSEEGTDEESVS